MAREEHELDGPFDYHVYIAFCPKDQKDALDLCRQLAIRNVILSHRDLKNELTTQIPELIKTSQKCLIFLSSAYLEDSHFQYETGLVLEKVKLFGKDTVIVMKTEPLLEVPMQLRGFRETVFDRKKLKQEEANAQLAKIITTEPVLNFTYGPASGYFFGYLKLILEDFRKRLIEDTLRTSSSWHQNTLKKMLIIVPESCFCSTGMEVPGKIEFTNKYVVLAGDRSGNMKRDFKNSLYKVIDTEQNNEEYYFAGEFATPVLTMYDTLHSHFCNMTLYDMYNERDVFYYTLKAILNHSDHATFKDQYKLVFWSDPECKKPNRLNLHQFLLSVLKKELELERCSEPLKLQASSRENAADLNSQLSTFERTRGVFGPNPASLYEKPEKYPMNREKRGKCLIINMINFKESTDLEQRLGSEKDTDILIDLFESLCFDVDVHIDLDSDALEKLLISTNAFDHSECSAFVCCILSHGQDGAISTSDGRQVNILDIVNHFGDMVCPKLKGKPKLFFIQACLSGFGVATRDPNEPDPKEPDPKEPDPEEPAMVYKHVLVPSSPDFLMSYSTLPGAAAMRHQKFGSYYIRALHEFLRKGDEVDRALKQVTKDVREQLESIQMTQLPFHLTTMERLIYL